MPPCSIVPLPLYLCHAHVSAAHSNVLTRFSPHRSTDRKRGKKRIEILHTMRFSRHFGLITFLSCDVASRLSHDRPSDGVKHARRAGYLLGRYSTCTPKVGLDRPPNLARHYAMPPFQTLSMTWYASYTERYVCARVEYDGRVEIEHSRWLTGS